MSEPAPMVHVDPLEYATTQALLNALAARFEHMIFMGHNVRTDGFDEQGKPIPVEVERWKWSGNWRICESLGFTMAKRISDSNDIDLIPIEPDESQ